MRELRVAGLCSLPRGRGLPRIGAFLLWMLASLHFLGTKALTARLDSSKLSPLLLKSDSPPAKPSPLELSLGCRLRESKAGTDIAWHCFDRSLGLVRRKDGSSRTRCRSALRVSDVKHFSPTAWARRRLSLRSSQHPGSRPEGDCSNSFHFCLALVAEMERCSRCCTDPASQGACQLLHIRHTDLGPEGRKPQFQQAAALARG